MFRFVSFGLLCLGLLAATLHGAEPNDTGAAGRKSVDGMAPPLPPPLAVQVQNSGLPVDSVSPLPPPLSHETDIMQTQSVAPAKSGVDSVTLQTAPGYFVTYPMMPTNGPPPGPPQRSNQQIYGPSAPAMFPATNGGMAPIEQRISDGANWRDRASASSFLENVSLSGALDGSKGPDDLGINANFGFRGAIYAGLPVIEEWGVGLQVGTALNYGRNTIGILPVLADVEDRLQSFTTIGLFQRVGPLNYGFAWDYRTDDYYDTFQTSQWRGQFGVMLGDSNEVGLFGSLRDGGDRARFLDTDVHLRAINQLNFFWKHVWEGEIVTRGWVGLANEHSRDLVFSTATSSIRSPFIFGADFYVPLSDCLALFGEAQVITPNDSGTLAATIGLSWYSGASARNQAHDRFTPVLPLANNTNFALDARP